jgi:formate dehydrogenase major subunit
LSFYNRFGPGINLHMDDLANAPNYLVRERVPRMEGDGPQGTRPLVRPLPARRIRE